MNRSPYQLMSDADYQALGFVWEPAPFREGGGDWKQPSKVILADYEIERIARAVVRMLKEQP